MDWIMRPLTSVTRGITQIQASASAGRRIVTFFQQTGKQESRFVASDMSHGTLHSLRVLVALRQKPVPSLVFVDAIEASSHISALSVLIDTANVSSKERCQVILSSHSTEVLTR